MKNRYDIDANQEVIAFGVADMGAAVFQGFAISGADSRTAVNDRPGGKSQVTSPVAAAALVFVLLFLTRPLSLLPIAVLAAVLIDAAIGLFDLEGVKRLLRISRGEFLLSIVTLLGVITVGVLQGVVIAITLALLQLLAKASYPHDALPGRTPSNGFRSLATNPDAVAIPGMLVYRFDSALLLFNADRFKARIREVVREAQPGVKAVILDAETMPILDTTGAATLDELHRELTGNQIASAVAAAKAPVRALLERAEIRLGLQNERMFPTVDAAVLALGEEPVRSRSTA